MPTTTAASLSYASLAAALPPPPRFDQLRARRPPLPTKRAAEASVPREQEWESLARAARARIADEEREWQERIALARTALEDEEWEWRALRERARMALEREARISSEPQVRRSMAVPRQRTATASGVHPVSLSFWP